MTILPSCLKNAGKSIKGVVACEEPVLRFSCFGSTQDNSGVKCWHRKTITWDAKIIKDISYSFKSKGKIRKTQAISVGKPR